MARRRKRKLPAEPVEIEIADIGHDGRGVGRRDGKAVFVHGALPGERVSARITEVRRDFDEGISESVLAASADRVEPGCPWFGYCGGCALQHLDHGAQLHWKQSRLEENLGRIGRVAPRRWLEPVAAEPWLYRRRARLSARLVRGKGRVLVGFREIYGRFVADVERCAVLHSDFADRLLDLSALLGELSVADAVPQIETASGDDGSAVVIRHLKPLTDADTAALVDWSRRTGVAVYLQPKGPDTVHRLHPPRHELVYRLSDFDVELAFHPQHFIQVNAEVNRRLVKRAVDLLDPGPEDRVLDLFCGLGNFTLPLARRAAGVTAVEGETALVEAGRDNAARNGLDNISFLATDLAAENLDLPWMRHGFESVLIDPPRSGAEVVLPLIAATGARRIVYVSCNPATLARDAGRLVHEYGYRLAAAGIADMFPHTAHVESIALFEKAGAA